MLLNLSYGEIFDEETDEEGTHANEYLTHKERKEAENISKGYKIF